MNEIIQGSLGAIAQQQNQSIAETFLNAEVIIIVDTSASMCQQDSRGGRSRYKVACEELKNLQASLPGKLALLSFSSDVLFCPNGIPYNYQGGTNLAHALQFAKMADVKGIRFIVISDGEPDSESEALNVAKMYKNTISTIYVGPEGGDGQDFLNRLAKASGGESIKDFKAKELSNSVQHLLKGS